MNPLKHLKTIGAGSAIALLVAIAASPASAQTKPLVTVINPTTSPVNIRGPVTVTNSVLPVEVSNADPIAVTLTTNQSPAETVQKAVGLLLQPGENVGTCELYTVPAGKRLIVEYANFVGAGDSSGEIDDIWYVSIRKAHPISPGIFYTLVLPGQKSPEGRVYSVSQPITMYADAGENVSAQLVRNAAANHLGFNCNIAGRLVDLTQ